MGALEQVVNALEVKNHIAFLQQRFGKVGADLSSDPGDQGDFARYLRLSFVIQMV